MPVLDHWKIPITVDDVLRAQGADPEVIFQRRPSLAQAAEDALRKAGPFLHPLVLYEKYAVDKLMHERLELSPNSPDQKKVSLTGSLVAQHLGRAQDVILMVCTIGNELDELVGSLFKGSPLEAIAMDGVGSAAVESLAIQACNYFEVIAASEGLKTSIPLNPGMIGWPVDQGQPEIFTLLDSELIGVSLNESCMMVPNKSLSMVLGVGKEVSPVGSSCDYCSLKGVCKYQNHYAK
jgi:hypothetical protein